MNMISTGAFLPEMDASNKQETIAEKFARVWEKKNSKVARAGGVSLMALSLAACGSSSDDTATVTPSTPSTPATPATPAPTGQSFALTTDTDSIFGTSGDDTITATDLTMADGDVVADSSGTDNDTLVVTAAADISATTTVVGVENATLNVNTALSSGDTTFQMAMDNISSSNISVDVTKADSLVSAVQLDNVKTGAVITLSDDFTTATIDGVNNGVYTVNLAADADVTITGATVDDVTLVSAKDITVSASSNDGDLTVSGEVLDITAATAAGAVSLTATDNLDIQSLAAATSIVATAGGTITLDTATDAATTVSLTTTGADADDHDVIVESGALAGAETVTIVSAGSIDQDQAGTAAVFGAATTLTLSADDDSFIDGDAAATSITVSSLDADADVPVKFTIAADGVDTLAFAGENAVIASIDLDDVDTETVSNTNTAASYLLLDADGDTSVDLSSVATDVVMVLGVDQTAADKFVLASGAQLAFDTTVELDNALTIEAEDTAATDNVVNLSTIDIAFASAAALNYDAVLSISHIQTVNIDATVADFIGTGVSLGGTTNNEVTSYMISGDETVTLDTVVGASGATLNASGLSGVLTIVMDNTADIVETVTGGSGNDIFTVNNTAASGNAFVINGGAGTDDVTMSVGTNDLTYNGGDGVDTLSVSGTLDLSSNTIDLTSVEQLSIEGTGDVTLSASVVSGKVMILTSDGAADALTIKADSTAIDLGSLSISSGWVAGTDTITIDGTGVSLGQNITGSSFKDTIQTSTTGAGDTIFAGEGGDVIEAGTGTNAIDLTETTAVTDTVQYMGGLDVITGFDFGGTGTDDDIIIKLAAVEGLFGGGKNLTELGTTDAASAGDVAAGDAISLTTATGAQDLDSLTTNILVANLAANIASTSALETALEVGGDLALTAAGDGAGNDDMVAGDIFLVAYDNGVDSFLAAVHSTATVDNTTFAAGSLAAQNIIQFVGVSDVTSLNVADFAAVIA